MIDQTIIAQTTPVGSGAVALLRLSGGDVFSIVNQFSRLPSGKKISDVDSHTVHFGYVVDGDRAVDQVMFIVMRAPKTFTGEHVVEITSHNNQFIIEEIIQLAIKFGARLAQRGEFAKRAFLHNKIDLLQAESINELIHASNQQMLKKSLSQITGSFSSIVAAIEKDLLKCLALSEASFEFLDDEIEFSSQISQEVARIHDRIKELKSSYNNQQHIREGVRITILGSVNAGKSSLFNALIKKDRAIVTDIAGTTRDAIEAGLYKTGSYLTLIDTAGIRETNDIVEQEGIRRSLLEAEKADIILLVIDGSRLLTEQELIFYRDILMKYPTKVLLINNKFDIGIKSGLLADYSSLDVSAQTGEGVAALEVEIDKKIKAILDVSNSPFLINKRHYNLLSSLQSTLERVSTMLSSSSVAYELLSIHLKDALAEVSELTGKTISEMSMDAIFKEFCVGK